METYSVTDVAEMLNVNEETIRRWIRNDRLKAKRAVGRGGNTIFLQDVIEFANMPPRAYLLSLEKWLNSNQIEYQKIAVSDEPESAKSSKRSLLSAASTLGMTAAATVAAPAVVPALSAATIALTQNRRKKDLPYELRLKNADSTEEISKHGLSEIVETADYFNIETGGDFSQVMENDQGSVPLGNDSNTNDDNKARSSNAGPLLDFRSFNVLDEIAHAKQLFDSGILTQDEFQTVKAKLIERI